MKRLFKKNQVIITTLAALIAIAGYLNHVERSEKQLSNVGVEPKKESTSNNSEFTEAESEIGNELAENQDTEGEEVLDVAGGDIESNEIDIEGEPGEAVFVNAVGTVDFIVEAKILREQTRASNKEMLMEIVNNESITEDEKKAAIDKLAQIADKADREMAAENLISARGYENVVVTITDDAADVMIVSDSLGDAERAQIEEIVKNKTSVSADKITITAVKSD